MKEHEERREDRLADAVRLLAGEIRGLRHAFELSRMENRIMKTLSEIKTDVAQASVDSTEALSELGVAIGQLDAQIASLVAAAVNPEVTDEVFEANLATVKANSTALKNIITGAPVIIPPTEPA